MITKGIRGGYVLQTTMQTSSPLDATTYHIGSTVNTLSTVSGRNKMYIPKSGRVTSIYFFTTVLSTLGSAETSTVYFRLNDTTDTVITATHQDNAAVRTDINTNLSIPVLAGEYFEIKWVTPTWATNPTNVRQVATVYISTP